MHAVLSQPFRPLFPAAALHGLCLVVLWVLWLTGLPDGGFFAPRPFLRHGLEMLTGFAGAIIGGFLLTASANWTGRKTTTPTSLLLLLALWLTGRLLPFTTLPSLCGLIVDTGFWLLIHVMVLRVVILGANWRNLGFALLPLAFGLMNLAVHLELGGILTGVGRPALWTGVDLLTLIMGAMGGRVIPFFTGRRLPQVSASNPAVLALTGNGLLIAVLATNLLWRSSVFSAWLMLAAGIVLLLRLGRWGSLQTRHEPMLWILHLGYAWLGIGLLVRGCAVLTDVLTETTAFHLITVGALGSLGLGMMARVALGHTGRVIRAGRSLTLAFLAVNLAALGRLAMVAGIPGTLAYSLSAAFWALAMLLYLVQFLPIVLRPRVG